MKLAFETRWLRVVVELLPAPAEIRRHRIMPPPLERQTCRFLRRQITRELAQSRQEVT